jgi:hypothetical protein
VTAVAHLGTALGLEGAALGRELAVVQPLAARSVGTAQLRDDSKSSRWRGERSQSAGADLAEQSAVGMARPYPAHRRAVRERVLRGVVAQRRKLLEAALEEGLEVGAPRALAGGAPRHLRHAAIDRQPPQQRIPVRELPRRRVGRVRRPPAISYVTCQSGGNARHRGSAQAPASQPASQPGRRWIVGVRARGSGTTLPHRQTEPHSDNHRRPAKRALEHEPSKQWQRRYVISIHHDKNGR